MGGPGCGKTLFGIQFLARGAVGTQRAWRVSRVRGIDRRREAERASARLRPQCVDQKLLAVEHALVIDRFVRSAAANTTSTRCSRALRARSIRSTPNGWCSIDRGAHSAGCRQGCNQGVVRAAVSRWPRNRGVTSIITAAEGDGGSRHRFEEQYRRLRGSPRPSRGPAGVDTDAASVKYRGSAHGTNEYPFLIDQSGIRVMPVTSIGLDHQVSSERVSTGAAARHNAGRHRFLSRHTVMTRARRDRASPASPHTTSMRRAGAASACWSPTKSCPGRSLATCSRSASTSRALGVTRAAALHRRASVDARTRDAPRHHARSD